MDKNTLLGLLLMGAVIFGFVYLNQPSAEEIERQRQERLAAEAEQTSAEAIQALNNAGVRMGDTARVQQIMVLFTDGRFEAFTPADQ